MNSYSRLRVAAVNFCDRLEVFHEPNVVSTHTAASLFGSA